MTPWDASRWDNIVWFLTATLDKVLPNCLRKVIKQYCPKLSEALPSEIWKTMPPFPEAFGKDSEDEAWVDWDEEEDNDSEEKDEIHEEEKKDR